MTRVEETAFAKINLDLRVCRRRDDGYHDLDSVVVFATIGDRLTFTPTDELSLDVTGPFATDLKDTDDNLVLKTVRAFASMLDRSPDVRVTLEKRLPIAAGLGGGSADAAATLRGLSKLWKTTESLADLMPLARKLGADVPVCLGSRAFRMQGTGEKLTPIDFPEGCPILLVNPKVAVPTPSVFRMLRSMSGERRQPWVNDDASANIHQALAESVNDLEAPAMRLEPVIGDVLTMIERQPGCRLTRMSGSGATCFGLFDDQETVERAASKLSEHRPDWWIVDTSCR